MPPWSPERNQGAFESYSEEHQTPGVHILGARAGGWLGWHCRVSRAPAGLKQGWALTPFPRPLAVGWQGLSTQDVAAAGAQESEQ